MKKLWLVIPALMLLLPSCTGDKKELDHFKAYKVDKDFRPGTRWIKDQIHEKYLGNIWRPVTPVNLLKFAVPVSKNRSNKKDPNAHLAWYVFEREIPIRKLKIPYKNQLTDNKWQQITIKSIVALLVPTGKKIDHGEIPIPQNLDHYICYLIAEKVGDQYRQFNLSDQFDEPGHDIDVSVDPSYFCVPCSKKNSEGDEDKGIKNADDHLTIYRLKARAWNKSVVINNQFGVQRFDITEWTDLLVPTKKDKEHIAPVTAEGEEEKSQ